MILKLFKAVWFLSVLAVLVNLLYVYAYLPEQVVVQDDTGSRILASREFLFYLLTALLLFINVLVYFTRKLFAAEENFRSWFHGLIITINIFFILGLNFVQVYNSGEKFDFSRIAFIMYASLGLMISWAITWPVYTLFRKIFAKQTVL